MIQILSSSNIEATKEHEAHLQEKSQKDTIKPTEQWYYPLKPFHAISK
jgi:hypothetical protein